MTRPDPGTDSGAEPWLTAAAAAGRAGVRIRPLTNRDDLVAAGTLLDRVWGVDPDGPGGSELQPHLLRALEHSGNYVQGAALSPAVATSGDVHGPAGPLVGASIAFLGRTDGRWSLHSHITGVLGEQASRGVGAALKWHQRAWCLDRGIGLVTWTFDPLIARNAWFNLGRLGARPAEYLVDFYGPMNDGRNQGQPTDRLGMVWDLHAPSTLAAAAALRSGGPVRAASGDLVDPPQRWLGSGPDGGPVDAVDTDGGLPAPRSADDDAVIAVPDDVEELWRSDPDAAGRWRLAVRGVLGAAVADPRWTVTAFRPRVGYVVTAVAASGQSRLAASGSEREEPTG